MNAKIVKRTLSLITVLALIFTLAVQGAGAIQSAEKKIKYKITIRRG